MPFVGQLSAGASRKMHRKAEKQVRAFEASIQQVGNKMADTSNYEGIVVTDRTDYSCLQKVVCCKWSSQEKILTSDIRKQTIKRMVEDYLVHDSDELLIDPVKLMILIYVCSDDRLPEKHICRCKLSPSTGVMTYRTDLEFYIPQLCNYLVFHRSLQNNYLRQAIQNMSRLNYYFGHLYYFYMKSLERNIKKTEIQILKPVIDYNTRFLKEMGTHYKDVKLTCLDLYAEELANRTQGEPNPFANNIIFEYQTRKMDYGKIMKVNCTDVRLRKYFSIFRERQEGVSTFQSSIDFFEDLFTICEEIKQVQDKKAKVIEFAKQINENLPSNAYIPFSKNSYRLCNILKIVAQEVRVFSTKQRAPVCLCLETYCPAEELSGQDQEKFWTNVEVPITLKMSSFDHRSSYFARNYEKTAEFKRLRQTSNKLKFVLGRKASNILEEERLIVTIRDGYHKRGKKNEKAREMQMREMPYMIKAEIVREAYNPETKEERENREESGTKSDKRSYENSHSSASSGISNPKTWNKLKKHINNPNEFLMETFEDMFGEPLKKSKQRLAKDSVFGAFKTWDILYVIVKTHDDLKQEQFAMQLIQQFDYIFKLEELPLMLTTYEVLSMGADRGIIEMVKDAVTFDSLQKTLKTKLPTKLTLKEFFEVYFAEDLSEAKENFVRSLAAYSLVMFVIQAKDRHNGNILLHRSGKMFHIDFGFFLSNMPGGGLQLQRDCPFKLLSEHVEVLDGIDSYYFKKFRQYFFLGFKAIRKHQSKVLMLVKLMYSSSGMTMPCFIKGEQTIEAMQARINPKNVSSDAALNDYCQRLINLSLDNWAAKWYDRFQYYAQGIFY